MVNVVGVFCFNIQVFNIEGVCSEVEVCVVVEDFESFFLFQMVLVMFVNFGEENLFGGGVGEKVFVGLLYEEYVKVMVQFGGLGLVDWLILEILCYQEVGGE